MADIKVLMPLIKQFMPFAQKQMGFDRPPKLFLKGDATNAADPFGKTGFYDPEAEAITLFTTDRHPKDILRSLSHELMHHTQNCRGDFTDTGEMGEGYAQNNPHMRSMEIEAYKASICFRDWEDSLKETIYFEHLQKGDKTMSIKDWKNGELKSLLSEAWGFKMDLNKLNENTDSNEPVKESADFTGAPAGEEHRATRADRDRSGQTAAGKCYQQFLGMDPVALQACLQAAGAPAHRSPSEQSGIEEAELGEAGLTPGGGHGAPSPEAKKDNERQKAARTAKCIQDCAGDRRCEQYCSGGAMQETKELDEDFAAKHRTAGNTIEEKAEEVEEMCGPDAEGHGGEEVVVMGDEEGVVGDEAADPATRVAALMDELKGLLLQLAGGEEVEEVPMDEKRARGRRDARHVVGRGPDARKRPGDMNESGEAKLREMVRKAIKEAMK